MPRASSLEAEILDNHDADVKLIASSGGVFEVSVDDRKIFSKKRLGRFPMDGEILSLLKS